MLEQSFSVDKPVQNESEFKLRLGALILSLEFQYHLPVFACLFESLIDNVMTVEKSPTTHGSLT
jgi:hypothetical protein